MGFLFLKSKSEKKGCQRGTAQYENNTSQELCVRFKKKIT